MDFFHWLVVVALWAVAIFSTNIVYNAVNDEKGRIAYDNFPVILFFAAVAVASAAGALTLT